MYYSILYDNWLTPLVLQNMYLFSPAELYAVENAVIGIMASHYFKEIESTLKSESSELKC